MEVYIEGVDVDLMMEPWFEMVKEQAKLFACPGHSRENNFLWFLLF